MKKILILTVFWGFALVGSAQTPDSVFTLQNLYSLIRAYHPVAKQADLIPASARANLMRARGAFDPYFFVESEQKVYKGKNYYQITDGGFKVPTWYGVEAKAVYENNQGELLNAENTLPPSGLVNVGISVPLAQGLVIDQRRAALKQAQIFEKAADWERLSILNQLLYDAAGTYWEWASAYYEWQNLQNVLAVSQARFLQVKSYYTLGDRAAIDTLEAFLQVQTRQYELNNGYIAYRNASLMLSNFLWGENEMPVEITDFAKPQAWSKLNFNALPSLDSLSTLMTTSEQFHPSLRLYHFKLDQLSVERQWKQEKLKPKVNMNYNLLTQEVGKSPFFIPSQNYKWGFSVSMPLFLREARGDVAMTRIKIQDARYAMEQKQREISNKIRVSYNDAENYRNQVALYTQMVDNYRKMLTAEEVRFFGGESSVFVVNARESKWLDAQIKLIELQAKYWKTLAGIAYAAGNLGNE